MALFDYEIKPFRLNTESAITDLVMPEGSHITGMIASLPEEPPEQWITIFVMVRIAPDVSRQLRRIETVPIGHRIRALHEVQQKEGEGAQRFIGQYVAPRVGLTFVYDHGGFGRFSDSYGEMPKIPRDVAFRPTFPEPPSMATAPLPEPTSHMKGIQKFDEALRASGSSEPSTQFAHLGWSVNVLKYMLQLRHQASHDPSVEWRECLACDANLATASEEQERYFVSAWQILENTLPFSRYQEDYDPAKHVAVNWILQQMQKENKKRRNEKGKFIAALLNDLLNAVHYTKYAVFGYEHDPSVFWHGCKACDQFIQQSQAY